MLSKNLTLLKTYTNHCTNVSGPETKRKKEFNLEVWEKDTSNTIFLFFVFLMKRQRNSAQMKEQTRNTEV